jgi:hypothetical protein
MHWVCVGMMVTNNNYYNNNNNNICFVLTNAQRVSQDAVKGFAV